MKRIVIGISGAGGSRYGIRLLEVLKALDKVKTRRSGKLEMAFH